MKKSEIREVIMQGIFQMEIQKNFNIDTVRLFVEDKKLRKKEELYILNTIEDFCREKEEIDSWINKYSKSYGVLRMEKVSLSCLRLAVYELLLGDEPEGVIVNEAVRINRKYASEDTTSMVNGILRNILRDEEFNK